MAKRKTELGLGRGLNALLGDPELAAPGEGSVSLPISQVQPGLNPVPLDPARRARASPHHPSGQIQLQGRL